MQAIINNNLSDFDHNIFKHIGHISRNKIRYILLHLTNGLIYQAGNFSFTGKYQRKLALVSAHFAYLSDCALILFGGGLKRKESLNGRFGDVLSYMYFATAILKRFKYEGQIKEDKIFAEYALQYCFAQIHIGFSEIYRNFGSGFVGILFNYVMGPFYKLNSVGKNPKDKLTFKITKFICRDSKTRDRHTNNIFTSKDPKEITCKLEDALQLIGKCEAAQQKIKQAIRTKKIEKNLRNDFQILYNKKIISLTERDKLIKLEALRNDIIQVDSFAVKDYLKHNLA